MRDFSNLSGKKFFSLNMAAYVLITFLTLSIYVGCMLELNKLETLSADAGENQICELSDNLTITLDGSKTDNYNDSIASFTWSCTSYIKHADVKAPYTTAQVTGLIINADRITASAALRKAGTYFFKLTVINNNGVRASDHVMVTVNPFITTVKIKTNFPGILAGSALDFTPEYGDSYEKDYVSYTLKDDVNGALESGIVDVNSYKLGETITFTQIFYNADGSEISRMTIIADVISLSGSQLFAALRDSKDTLLPAAPELDLYVTRTVVEVL